MKHTQLWEAGSSALRLETAQGCLPGDTTPLGSRASTCPHFLSILVFMWLKGSVVSARPGQLVREKRKLQLQSMEKPMDPVFGGAGWLWRGASTVALLLVVLY